MHASHLNRSLIQILSIATCALAQAPGDATALLAQADGYRNFKGRGFRFDLELENETRGTTKSYKLSAKVADSHRMLLTYEEPAHDRGAMLLTNGTNLWFRAAGSSRPLRISPQQRLVGEASNGDVASTDFSGDYTASMADDPSTGDSLWALDLKALPKGLAAYSSLRLFVRRTDARPVRADFFAPSGKLLKQATYTRYGKAESAGGRMQLLEMEITNPLQAGDKTRLKYSGFALATHPDATFRPEALEGR